MSKFHVNMGLMTRYEVEADTQEEAVQKLEEAHFANIYGSSRDKVADLFEEVDAFHKFEGDGEVEDDDAEEE
jgi:hypothetical protein